MSQFPLESRNHRKSTLFIGGDKLSTTNPNIDPGPAGLTVKDATDDPDGTPSSTNIPSHGEALLVTVDEGIFYTEGFFVLADKQNHAVFKTTNGIRDYRIDPLTAVVGFGIQREIVTSTGDSTLLDPAQGSYNYNAPGADRYKLELNLNQRGLTGSEQTGFTISDDTNFFELARIIEGKTTRTDPIVVETSLNDAATLSQTGTSSGTANILKGVDVAAA